jgi:hypothetical protein
MIQSFLMIGQSNMAGRGFIKDAAPIYNESIKMLRNGQWQTMYEPVNCDRPTSGIGPGASFAAAWRLNNSDDQAGLIPCADGGSSLDDWAPGGTLFANAIAQATLAKRTSNIKGILWHQGENDAFGGRSASYSVKFSALISALRAELAINEIPLIVGGLGDFLVSGRYGQYFTEVDAVNDALKKLPDTLPDCYFVTAAGLLSNPDGLHFSAAAQRILGIRYFTAWNEQRNIIEPGKDEAAILAAIDSRVLSKSEKSALLEIRFGMGGLSLEEYETQLPAINLL